MTATGSKLTGPSPTVELCDWISALKWQDIPENIKTRVKYLVLDGIACALVGSHLDWSETATQAVLDMESAGSCSVIGWKGVKTGVLASALLNSAFIQGFELDDYHSVSPLHSNSILLPALFAAVQHEKVQITGKDFLLALVVGYEIGPRIGLSVNGGLILSRGWHSGPVFGSPTAAGAVGKLLNLSPENLENAFGIGATQSCGLMSAQFESSVKRMQHGFAARNGLFAAMMAKKSYKGISRVFEREYGGYCSVFTLGGNPAAPEEITKGLSEHWETTNINVKVYPSMAGTHATIDCIFELLEKINSYGAEGIKEIKIEMGKSAYHHGGWVAERPLNAIGAQMNNAYMAAAVIVDKEVRLDQFADENINRDSIWDLMYKTKVIHQKEFDALPNRFDKLCTRTTVTFIDDSQISSTVVRPKGVKEPTSNQEIVEKFRQLTNGIITSEEQSHIENIVLGLESCSDISLLIQALDIDVKNPLSS
jgi:aconitate decarboxylase